MPRGHVNGALCRAIPRQACSGIFSDARADIYDVAGSLIEEIRQNCVY